MFLPLLQDITWILPYRTESLTIFFQFFRVFGQPALYIFFLATWFWHSGSRLSVFMAFTTCVATFVCNFMKLIFQIPRPPIEYHLIDASSFGFPSGDVLLVTTFWIVLAVHFRNRLLSIFCLILIPTVMVSRVYFGVHSPLDVTVGMLVGIATAAFLLSQNFKNIFESWLTGEKLKLYWIIITASFIVVAISFPETINNPLSVAFGAFFGLGIALSKGMMLDHEKKVSLYILSAAITMLAVLYIFIPSTLISGQYKWLNQTVKFAIITSYIFYFIPRCFKTIHEDEDLNEA